MFDDDLDDERLRRLFYNNATVNHAITAWRAGLISKEDAYKEAMMELAETCDELKKQQIWLIQQGTFPPVIIPSR